ncbi:phosphatidylglycerophosphatase A [bacterium]|nr:phosphatidylglycerophosphatase A [bacterium]
MGFDEEKSSHHDRTGEVNAPSEGAKSCSVRPGKRNAVSPRTFHLATILSTGFGVGYSPVAPGTLGAVLGVGVYWVLLHLGAADIIMPLMCCGLFLAGVYLSSIAERHFQEKDPGRIVIDELASFPLTMLFISPSLTRIVIAFVLNRAADILKPFPAGRIQKLTGGWGIMLDDTVAAIYANLLLRFLILVLKV